MSRGARLPAATIALPEPALARRRFTAAAGSFDAACAAHDHARAALLARLDWLQIAPRQIVDAGCGTGRGALALQQRYPDAQLLCVDSSQAMLTQAAAAVPSAATACCDVQALPLPDRSVDLLLGCCVLPWVDPQQLLGECARVLAPGGLLLLATTGPATLQELRRAWRSVDDDVHVHASVDMQTLGDMLVRAGLHDPVLDTEQVTLSYSTPARLHEELAALGARNAAPGRRRTLTGRARFAQYQRALQAEAGTADGLAVTLELVYAHAWGAPDRADQAPPQPQFYGIPLRRE